MTIAGIGISPTALANAAAAGSVSDAEVKVRKVDEVLRNASKEWQTFGSSPAVKAVNAGRTLSPAELTSLVIDVIKLVRGTAAVLAAEQTALTATVQALKNVNRKW